MSASVSTCPSGSVNVGDVIFSGLAFGFLGLAVPSATVFDLRVAFGLLVAQVVLGRLCLDELDLEGAFFALTTSVGADFAAELLVFTEDCFGLRVEVRAGVTFVISSGLSSSSTTSSLSVLRNKVGLWETRRAGGAISSN
jgi:hypothetical protein